MPSYKTYTTEQYQAFLSQPFGYDFGVSDETIAQWFMIQPGARPVINSYSVTKANLLSDYIPKLKQEFGGSLVFLMTTVSEGGGAGNWVNHYMSDTSNTGMGCMIDDIAYVKTTFDRHFPPAMSAPEVGGVYTEDSEGLTMQVYNAVPDGSIGSYFIPSTMAGNAWIFGSQWCLANQGAAPPAVYFGNPYDQLIDIIKSFGADPFKEGSTAKPNPDTPKGDPNESGNKPKPKPDIQKAIDKILDEINKALENQTIQGSPLLSYNNDVTIERTFNNSYKISYTSSFKKKISDMLNASDLGLVTDDGAQNNPPKEDPKPPSIEAGKESKTMKKIYDWCNQNQGQAFDTDGYYGAQCVDLISWLNTKVFGLGLDTSGDYAKDIWNNPVPAGWYKVNGNPNDDNASREIWNTLPNGAIVWWTNSGAGHVGVKAGDFAQTLQQNWTSHGLGGPIVLADCASWMASSSSGFLGAWVTDN